MTEEEIKNMEEEETPNQQEETTDNTENPETPNEAEQEELDPLEKALAEIEDLKTQMLYNTAEFDNYRKRTLK